MLRSGIESTADRPSRSSALMVSSSVWASSMNSRSIWGSTCITDSSSSAWRSMRCCDCLSCCASSTREVTSATVTIAWRISPPSRMRSKVKVRNFCSSCPLRLGNEASTSFKGLILAITLSVLAGLNSRRRKRAVSSWVRSGVIRRIRSRKSAPASSSWPKICRVAAEYLASIASSGVSRNRPSRTAPIMVSVRPSERPSSTLACFRPAVLAANWSTIWLNESASTAISSRPGMLTRTSSSPSRTRVAASARVVTGVIQRRERNR